MEYRLVKYERPTYFIWRALLDKIICLLNLGFDRGNISFALVLLPLDSWHWVLISETYILP